MSDRLTPGPEAKARIQAHSEKDFLAFFDELPVAGMQRVARYLPKVDGFRQTSSLGIAQQKIALARRLGRQNVSDRELEALYMIWREWTGATFGNAVAVQELIDQVEDAAENAQDEETRRLAIDNKVDALFAKLNEDSRQNLCTREQIERFLEFSPLPQTDTARRLTASSKASSEVKHDTAFNELPDRLQRAETDLKEVRAQIDRTSERTDQNLRSVTEALSDVRELRTTTSQSKQEIDRLRADGQQHAAEQSRIKEEVTAKEKATDTRLKSLSDQVNDARLELQAIRLQIPDGARIDESLAKLATSIVEGDDRERTTTNTAITRFQAELDQLTRDLITLSQDRTFNDKFVSLMARISEVEAQLARAPLAAIPEGAAPAAALTRVLEPASRLLWEPLAFQQSGTATAIETPNQIASGFSAALQTLGLRKQAADVFGEECAAAFIARQAIFLKGAFAVHAARLLAASMSGGSAARLSMPVGLANDQDLRAAIMAAFPPTRQHIGGFVIEGVDVAPMQMVRETIADCLFPRRGMQPHVRIAVIATLSEGMASLPLEKAYFELGPVFDLDLLDWRSAYLGETSVVANTLKPEADQSQWDGFAAENIDTSEAVRLARSFSKRPEPAIEQTILRAFRALHFIRRKPNAVTPLQSLFYGWLLPYWRLQQITRDQVDTELDGGKVNGTEADKRLATLLLDFPEQAG